VLAIWIALFAAISHVAIARHGQLWGGLLVPFIWTGLEYFRSELYYLRFSWLNVGYAFSHSAALPAYKWLGIYGVGFCAMSLAVIISQAAARTVLRKAIRPASATAILLILCGSTSPNKPSSSEPVSVKVAGVQMEFPNASEIVPALDKLLTAEPATELFVLSEYTLDGPVPEPLRNWCRQHERYLIVGGKDEAPNSNFYDTAFVVGPKGEIVFRQVKSVPIQFFKDGLPAPEQKLWDSHGAGLAFACVMTLVIRESRTNSFDSARRPSSSRPWT
jgi:apolipoprotein N-acyltransferase